jgi:hypothetical protein
MNREMKKILYFLTAIVLLTSCDEFLEEQPKSKITEVFATTPAGLDKLIISVYQTNNDLVGDMMYITECAGTDLWTNTDRGRLDGGAYDDSKMISNGQLYNVWKKLYNSINVVNLARFSVDKTTGLSDDKIKEYTAETCALRSYYYWMLVELYGKGTHLSLEHTTAVKTEGNQAGVPAIYKQIFEDINKGVADLPATNSFGRLNSAVAKALKMRYLLSLANQPADVQSAVGLSATECYTQVSQLADDIKTNYSYSLYDDFDQLFKSGNDINSEILWSIQYTDDQVYNNGGNCQHRNWIGKYNVSAYNNTGIPALPSHSIWHGREYRHMMPSYFATQMFNKYDKRWKTTFKTVITKLEGDWETAPTDSVVLIRSLQVINNSEMIDSLRSKNPVSRAPYLDSLKKYYDYEDRSFDYTDRPYVPVNGPIYLEGVNHIYDMTTKKPTNLSDYHIIGKFLDPTRLTAKQGGSHRDVYLIRLAEVMLMKAEAEFKLGNSGTAATEINDLRQRVEIAGHEDELNVEASDVDMNFILDEYGRELFGELFRWFILKRSGVLVQRIKNTNPDCADLVKDYHIVRPVPQRALDQVSNKDTFVQNDGYPKDEE